LPTLPTSPFPCPAANFYHSVYNPKTNTNTCEGTNNIASSIELMMSGESTEILSNYFTQAKIKTNTTNLARTTACQVLKKRLHSKASHMNHKENLLQRA